MSLVERDERSLEAPAPDALDAAALPAGHGPDQGARANSFSPAMTNIS